MKRSIRTIIISLSSVILFTAIGTPVLHAALSDGGNIGSPIDNGGGSPGWPGCVGWDDDTEWIGAMMPLVDGAAGGSSSSDGSSGVGSGSSGLPGSVEGSEGTGEPVCSEAAEITPAERMTWYEWWRARKERKAVEKAEKEARKAAEKAEKEARKAAEKLEKAEKEARKAAEKAEKEARKAAEKAEKAARKAAEKAEKAARLKG